MSPGDPTARAPTLTSRLRGVRRSVAHGWRDLLAVEALWIGLFLIVGLWVLLPSQAFFTSRVQTGDIAGRAYVATRELLLEDTETLEEKRELARAEVLPVYDLEPAIAGELDDRWLALFEVGRESLLGELGVDIRLGDRGPEGLEQPPRSTLEEFLAASPLQITPQQLSVLNAHEFRPVIEDRLRSTSDQILRRGLVSDKPALLENRDRGVTIRNLVTSEEEIELDLYRTVAYPDEARELIETESRRWTDIARGDRGVFEELILANLAPNLELNRSETRDRHEAAADATVPVWRRIQAGQIIVRKGDEIDATDALFINGNMGRQRYTELAVPALGKWLLLSLAAIVVWLVVKRESDLGDSGPTILGGLLLILIVSLLSLQLGFLTAAALGGFFETAPFNTAEIYHFAVPFASVGLVTFLLYGRNLSVAVSLVFALLAGQMVDGGSMSLVLISLAGSLAAIYFLATLKKRSGVARASLLVGCVNMVTALMVLSLEGDRLLDLRTTASTLALAFVGGLLVSAVAGLVLPVFETVLGRPTDFTLIELSNTNLPLLRRLAFEAPGTFQHSLMVANLAKGGCAQIEANAVLAYTASLYHDIGKILRPDYFIENQRLGQNPHDRLSPSLSALIVIKHVKEGLELAEEHRLPGVLHDAISQHHGTHLLSFFHTRAVEQAREAVSESAYRYPGPKPQNKVMGVLMLADAVEAASRTLQDASLPRIRNLVRQIFDSHIQDGQLDETDLTLADLDAVSGEFERILSTVHHRRVDYPGFDFDADQPPPLRLSTNPEQGHVAR